MTIRRRTFAVAATASVLALTLAACSPVSNGSSSSSGHTLTIGVNQDPMTNLDRFVNYGYPVDDTGNIWADPLVTSDHHQHYSAALATKWSSSADGLTWTFTLRKGVKFSSGNAFTSADVKETFTRLITDKTLTDAGGWGGLDSVETPDASTAIIKLKAVMPTFLDEVGRVMVIDSKAYASQGKDYFYKPSGTGAFTVSSFNRSSGETIFKKNTKWWGWTSANKTDVDEIDYKYITDDSTRAAALQSGTIDVAAQLPMTTAKALSTSTYKVDDVANDTHYHLAFQSGSGKVFADKNLREALSLAVDRSQLTDGILGGSATVATWPVPKGNLGFKDGTSYQYDLAKAKQLVQASSYKGQQLTMLYTASGFPQAAEIAQAIQSMASKAGIDFKLQEAENVTFNQLRGAGKYDVALGSFAATDGDPQTEAGVIIAHDVFGTKYTDTQITKLANESATMTDRTQRGQVLQQLFQLEFDDYSPFVYLYSAVTPYAMNKDVSGLTVYADGSAAYKFATIK